MFGLSDTIYNKIVLIRKKKTTLLLALILVGASLYLLLFNPTFTINIQSKLRVLPIEDWELQRTTTGSVMSLYQNHLNNTNNKYSLSEFSRGDVIQIHFLEGLSPKTMIKKGDTLGYVVSNQEQRSLAILKGQLDVLKSELLFYTTGQKPEDVDFASSKVILAEQELLTQKKLMERSKQLFKDSIISPEQYDIDLNALKVAEWNLTIAKANLSSVDTGEKPEMEILINSKIAALEKEIDWIEKRIALLTITSPIDGFLEVNHNAYIKPIEFRSESLIKINNLNPKVGVVPIPLKKLKYFKENAVLCIGDDYPKTAIYHQDNVAQTSIYEAFVYFVVLLPENHEALPGEIIDVIIEGQKVNWFEYFKSLVQ